MMKPHKYFCFLIFALAACFCLSSQAKNKVDIFDLTFDDNFKLPAISKAIVAQRVQEFQNNQAITLIKNNLEVELTRNGEVIIVTIPADELFAPNDTTLLNKSKDILSKFLKFTKSPGMYKMLLVMHSDNTGTHEYAQKLTSARVNSVYEWFDANGGTKTVVPYAFGEIQPLQNNDSMEKRRLNRRLEIYIVPDEEMINQAKNGKVTGITISNKRK